MGKHTRKGFALVVVIAFAAISLLTLGGALTWTSSTSRLTERNNTYFNTLAAAEAATEKVIARISRDFQYYGEGVVYSSLPAYSDLHPTSTEDNYWQNFTFSNGSGDADKTYVSRLTAWGYTNLNSQYSGLRGMASTYRVISNARNEGFQPMTAALMQEFQIASIPVFQFAIFYTMDLEINPGPHMTVNGRVHSNGTIYTEPVNSITYLDHVTAAGNIYLHKSPLDPSTRSVGTVNFQGEHDARVSALTLPIGTNNSPSAVRAIIDIPPSAESPNSLLGKQRYYNKSDLVIVVSNGTVTTKSGAFDNFSTIIPQSQVNAFLRTNASFFDKREGKTVKAVELDVAKLRTWSTTNTLLRPLLNRDVSAVFIADKRTQTASTQPGVRVVNGAQLPNSGLTISTPNPLYVKGHFNAPSAHRGTTNTTLTKPSSLVADSITILSGAWADDKAASGLGSRGAESTTVNAAFLSGIVPSNGVRYSGGVENFPRFLENWSGKTLTYNGSMVVMFYSEIANAPWGSNDVYNPPDRKWAFDLNFMDATKLPPGTPQLLTLIRGRWSVLPPNTVL
ncbi:MAG: hypothetical protein ACXW3L_02775 [Limisphaerales bacterium]